MARPDVSRHVLAKLRNTAEQVRATPAGGEIASPCISVCRMNASAGLCEGCLRTLDEITQWGRASDGGKRAVWQALAQRAAVLEETAS